MMRDVGPRCDAWPAALAVTAGVTSLPLLAGDRYVELVAAASAYAATWAIVHHGPRPEHEEAAR